MSPAAALCSVLARLGPALLLLPTARHLLYRALWALAAALLLAPLLVQHAPTVTVSVAWLVRELLVGGALGLWAALPLLAVRGAGQVLEGGTGPLARLVRLLGLVAYVSAGGHRLMLDALGRSYQIIPSAAALGEGPALSASMASVLWVTAQIPLLALLLAAPLLAALLLAELGLRVVLRLLDPPRPSLVPLALPLLLLAALLVTAPLLLRSVDSLMAAYAPTVNPLLPR